MRARKSIYYVILYIKTALIQVPDKYRSFSVHEIQDTSLQDYGINYMKGVNTQFG